MEVKLVLGEDGSIFNIRSLRSMEYVSGEFYSKMGVGVVDVGIIIISWRFLFLLIYVYLA